MSVGPQDARAPHASGRGHGSSRPPSRRRKLRRLKRRWKKRLRRHRVLVGVIVSVVVLTGIGVATMAAATRGNAPESVGLVPYTSPSSSSSTPAPGPTGLDDARAALATGDTVLVLGDSTGHAIDQWVALWARSMTDHRTVLLRQWDQNAQRWAPDFTHLGGTGRLLTVWNLSDPGATPDYPTSARLATVDARPDLVIYSYGHNDTTFDIGPKLDGAADRVRKRWGEPTAVAILQNPSNGTLVDRDRQVVNQIRNVWAPQNGVATIDVEHAFNADPRPLSSLLRDVTHPNDAGSALWAATVAAALRQAG